MGCYLLLPSIHRALYGAAVPSARLLKLHWTMMRLLRFVLPQLKVMSR
jgi:hypothetical protein